MKRNTKAKGAVEVTEKAPRQETNARRGKGNGNQASRCKKKNLTIKNRSLCSGSKAQMWTGRLGPKQQKMIFTIPKSIHLHQFKAVIKPEECTAYYAISDHFSGKVFF